MQRKLLKCSDFRTILKKIQVITTNRRMQNIDHNPPQYLSISFLQAILE